MDKTNRPVKNSALFNAEMRHTADTVKRMTMTQYNTFSMKRKLAVLVLALAMILFGTFSGTNMGIVILGLGCFILMGINTRAKMIVDQILKEFNGSYPQLRYHFTHSGLQPTHVQEEYPYRDMIWLIDDGNFLYLFLKNKSGFMVDKSTIKGQGGVDGLKALVERQTGLKWKKPFNLLRLRLTDIRDILSVSGAADDGQYTGERLDDRRH